MNPLNWMKNKVINLLALMKKEDERPSSMTILPDYETAFLLSLARAYDNPEKKPNEFLSSFYDNFEKYLVAVAGKAREDVKEVYTRKEFFEHYLRGLQKDTKKEEQGVRLA